MSSSIAKTKEVHAILKMLDPALAAMYLADFLDEKTTEVEAAYRSMISTEISACSLELQKQKLKVYYACKQKDKAKCRTELDIFRDKANAILMEVMEGEVTVAIDYRHKDEFYTGDQDSENVRRMSVRRTRFYCVQPGLKPQDVSSRSVQRGLFQIELECLNFFTK